MGKPMLVSVGADVLGIEAGTPLLLDAERGLLHVDPPQGEFAAAEQALRQRRERDAVELEAARTDCRTADGQRIEVFANIGSAAGFAAAPRFIAAAGLVAACPPLQAVQSNTDR